VYGLRVVLRDTSSIVVHDAKIVLSFGLPLLSSRAEPFNSLRIVLWNACALKIHYAEISLGQEMSSQSCFPIPANGLRIVFLKHKAIIVHDAYHVLDRPDPLGRRRDKRKGCQHERDEEGLWFHECLRSWFQFTVRHLSTYVGCRAVPQGTGLHRKSAAEEDNRWRERR